MAFSASGEIVLVNDALARLLGHGGIALVGRPIGAVFPTLSAGAPELAGRRVDLTVCHEDGSTLPVVASFAGWVSPSGPMLVARLSPGAEASAGGRGSPIVARNGFLDLLAHELRSPLQAMLGWAQYLRLRREPEAIDRGLDAIERNVRGQAQIVDDLLERAQLLAPGFRLEMRAGRLGPAVERALGSIAETARERNIALVLTAEPNEPEVVFDPVWIERALVALLRNALRFSGDGGAIQVQLDRQPASIGIVVDDSSGPPVPTPLRHLFDPFRDGGPAETSAFEPLGVGLGNAQRIAELHGGSVRAESRGEGRGARFEIILPTRGAGDAPRT